MENRPFRFKKKFLIPIFDADVYLVVADNIAIERAEMDQLFGSSKKFIHDYDALCAYSGRGHFGLFFTPKSFNRGVIAHELFHLTHRIMDWCGCNFDATHHEQGALLHQYLAELVANEFDRMKKRKTPQNEKENA